MRNSYKFLLTCVLLYALGLLFHTLINVEWYRFLDKLGGKIIFDIRKELYNALLKSDYEKIMGIGKEKLKNILFMDTLDIFRSVTTFTVQTLANGILIVVYLIVSAFIDWKLTILLLAASVIGLFISMGSRKAITNASMSVNMKIKSDNQVSNEFVDALELAKSSDLDTYFVDKCHDSLYDFLNTSRKADRPLVFLKSMNYQFHQVVSMAMAALLTMTMSVSSAGDLVFYLFITDMVLGTSQEIENNIYTLLKMMPSFENVFRVLGLERQNGSRKIDAVSEIAFQNVDFHYEGSDNQIFCGKNEVFKKGDVVRITGANGGGKSTFVKLIKGLLYPKKGQILVNHVPTKDISQESMRKEILYIDQDEILLNGTVKEYLEAVAGREVSEAEIGKLRKKVRFDSEIQTISNNGMSLSGGQRKKLMLMKLLLNYRDSSVIILDELEAGLDAETKKIVLQIEEEIIREKTDCIIFKITHEEEQLQFNKTVMI